MGNNLNKISIVYLTVNLVNWKIYVGVHDIDPNNEWDGYIGNGVNVFSPSSIKHPKEPFVYAVKKYGFDAFRRFTLARFNTRKEALDLERIIVNEEFITREDTYNIALGGGDPPHNYKKVYQYDLNGNFIQEFESIISAAKCNEVCSMGISHAVEFKIISAKSFWTDYYIEKLDVTTFNNTLQRKNVYLYYSDGEFQKEFESINECARELNSNLAVIQRAIKTQTKVKNYYISFEKLESFSKQITKKHYNDAVHQYTLNGEYVKTFNNVKEVVETLGKTYSQIPSSIRLGGTCGGYQWSWEKHENMSNLEKNVNKSRKVGQYTTDGKLVKVFPTLRACRKEFGNVGKVLKGQAKHCKGYTFKYED